MKKFIFILTFIFVAISAKAQYIAEYQSNNGHVYQLYQQPTIENIDKYQVVINQYESSLKKYKDANTLFWSAFGVEMAGIGVMGLSLIGRDLNYPIFITGSVISGVAGIVATVGLVRLCIAGSELRQSQILLSANGIVMTF